MNRTISAAVLVTLLAGTAAVAGTPPHWTSDQNRSEERDSRDRNQGRNHGRDYSGDRRYARDPRPDWRNHDQRYEHRDIARERYRAGRYDPPRGYYTRHWHRGERLPRAYYARPYVVYGYRDYRLYDPPRGYYWVRVGDDVLLTAIATGIVLDAVYSLYY
jgi:Ni/Co efflux regulator RcnB